LSRAESFRQDNNGNSKYDKRLVNTPPYPPPRPTAARPRTGVYQQAADELGCNLHGGAGEEGWGESWELLGGSWWLWEWLGGRVGEVAVRMGTVAVIL